MKKNVEKVYFIYLLAVGVVFLYMCATFRLNIVKQDPNFGYELLEEYTVRTYNANSAPQGIRQEYKYVLQDVKDNYNYLIFYTIHQNVSVYLDEKCIYSMQPSSKNAFGKTSGDVWNSVFFGADDVGKTVRIVISPVYKSSIDIVPTFYFGNRFDILLSIIGRGVPVLALSVLAMLMGLIFVLFSLFSNRSTEAGNSLIHLGIFSILIGLWKMTDAEIFGFASAYFPVVSYVPFMALMLLGIPFALYIKELYRSKENKSWYIYCIISLVQIGIVMLLQLFFKVDLRQTLFSTHLVMGMAIVLTVAMSCIELRKSGWSPRLKCSIFCMLACFVGTVVDIARYYLSNAKEVSIFATFFFVIYICVMGVSTIQDAKKLMAVGIRAQHYEQIAYHDQLTGLNNRTAYAEKVGNGFDADRYIVVMCDLNDLKRCNDVLGHDKGDVYIRESARIIKESFGDLGDCYRLGGDEFCVLLGGCGLEQCRKRIELMHEKVKAFNEADGEINMQIACGFEMYDKRIDYDIGDTARRADKRMYQEKFAMKQGQTR